MRAPSRRRCARPRAQATRCAGGRSVGEARRSRPRPARGPSPPRAAGRSVGARAHVPAEGGELAARADARAVDLGARARGAEREEARGAPRERTACAVAGSGEVPNSSRSPPLQNAAPAPSSTISAIETSSSASASASASASRIAEENALRRRGRSSVRRERAPSRAHAHRGTSPRRASRCAARRRATPRTRARPGASSRRATPRRGARGG